MKKLLVLAAILSACGSTASPAGAPSVELSEGFVIAAGDFSPGVNEFSITNTGEFGHTLVIANQSGNVLDATDVIGPNESLDFSVDLPPGLYEFSCRIVAQIGDGTLVDHYQEGMHTQVEVSDP